MREGILGNVNRRVMVVIVVLSFAAISALMISPEAAWADDDNAAAGQVAVVEDRQPIMASADTGDGDTVEAIVVGGDVDDDQAETEDAQIVLNEAGQLTMSVDASAQDETVSSMDDAASMENEEDDADAAKQTASSAGRSIALATQSVGTDENVVIATQAENVIVDGAYTIKPSAAYGQALGNKNSYTGGAAVQSYAISGSYDQMFYFQHVRNGLYSIFSIHSGLALTASGGKIVQSSYSGSDGQLFEVRASGPLYAFISKVGAITATGDSQATVQGYSGSSSQRFRLVETATIIPGVQVVRTATDTGKAVRAKDGSASAGVNAQVAGYSNDGTYNLVVQRDGSGYAVRPISSGYYLSPSGSTIKQNTGSYVWNARFSTSGDRRGVMLVNGNTAAQVSGGSLSTASADPAKAKSFLPSKSTMVSSGYYNIVASNGNLIDVANGSFSAGANIQVFANNGTGAQVFYLEDIGGGVFLIKSSKSYKVLEAKGGGTGEGTNVWQFSQNVTAAQLWIPVIDKSGRMTFVNGKSGKALTVAGGNVCINTSDGRVAQHWTLVPTKQYSLTGNSELDRIVANVLGTHTTLKSAFDYVAYGFSYREGNRHWSGWSLSDSTSRAYAIEMYNYGSGNCYRFASLFAWLARGLGYTDVTVRTGWVVGYSTPQAPHGWVVINGRVCDPDMQHEASGRDWYWQTYASAPTAYYSW